MVNCKRKNGVWHHRVPDFQLVYCGPDKYITKKRRDYYKRRQVVNLSLIDDEDQVSDKRSEPQKKELGQ